MKSPQEIAQWVIDNRYSKNEKDKISDFVMYNFIVDEINNLLHPIKLTDTDQNFTDYKEEK